MLSHVDFTHFLRRQVTRNLITVQPPRSIRSSSLVTLGRPSTSTSLHLLFVSECFTSSLESTPGFAPSTMHSDSPGPLSGTSYPVPSTHHSHQPSPTHSFIPGLKPSFSANPSFLFFFTTDSSNSPDYLQILLSLSIFTFSFSVYHF